MPDLWDMEVSIVNGIENLFILTVHLQLKNAELTGDTSRKDRDLATNSPGKYFAFSFDLSEALRNPKQEALIISEICIHICMGIKGFTIVTTIKLISIYMILQYSI